MKPATPRTIGVLKVGCVDVHTHNLLKFLATLRDVRIVFLNPLNLHATSSAEYRSILENVATQMETINIDEGSLGRLGSRLTDRLNRIDVASVILGRFCAWRIAKKLLVAIKRAGIMFDEIICVAEVNLHLAGYLKKSLGVDITYYSLELWDKGNFRGFREWLVQRELQGNNSIDNLLVQDEDRHAYFVKTRQQDVAPKPIFIPLGMHEQKIEKPSGFLADRLDLPAGKRVVLYWGQFVSGRFIPELYTLANTWKSDEFVFVFQGGRRFRELGDTPFVVATDLMVDYADISPNVIASCDVGLALYTQHDANNMLTAYSSEKIARYCQCGKPFIAIRNKNYETFRTRFHCCELVDSLEEIPEAIEKIVEEYPSYCDEAYRAFDEVFAFEKSAAGLRRHLCES